MEPPIYKGYVFQLSKQGIHTGGSKEFQDQWFNTFNAILDTNTNIIPKSSFNMSIRFSPVTFRPYWAKVFIKLMSGGDS